MRRKKPLTVPETDESESQPADPRDSLETVEPERFPVAIRAYVSEGREEKEESTLKRRQAGPSEWSLIFDTETTTDPSQRLRFGAFQVWRRGEPKPCQQGVFYDPAVLSGAEQATLRRYATARGLTLLTAREFIEEVFFGIGFDFRASIIGFNLPFDISRLAHDFHTARLRRRTGMFMRGGFSFKISTDSSRSRVQVKHHSQRLAFMRFTGAEDQTLPRSARKRKQNILRRRGFFIDLKTIGAALSGQSHTLESLARSLGVEHQKHKTEEHGKKLTHSYIDYAVQDAKATWSCFKALRDRYSTHRLRGTPLHQIYSEAGLGKAYLREMGIESLLTCQSDFPNELLGVIMSSYYGGRAEVHLRRVISQVLYCDFRSMYPTVCTLMRLWDFVTAKGVTWRETGEETQNLLARVTLADLQRPQFWPQLHTLVQVRPEADIFPVRAKYGATEDDTSQYTIGLNYLTSEFPLWYTLADCIASKLLTGKAPVVAKAYTFFPGQRQSRLWPVDLMGNPAYRVDPTKDDFYRRLIDLRTEIQKEADRAPPDAAARLKTERFALKILANATSYGIFVELNVEGFKGKKTIQLFGPAEKAEPIASDKSEKPGNYFHPLLGTLITGAARLMLAIGETLVRGADLDWAFCDTDSMAIAKPARMPNAEFLKRAQAICEWFTPLNPYAAKGPLLEIEDENRALRNGKTTSRLHPLFCYAVSAKRYALFNIDSRRQPVLRRVSAHGLGHLIPPYEDEKAPKGFPAPIVNLGDLGPSIRRWHHDVWHRIICAALVGQDTNTNPAAHKAFDPPAASRYHATTRHILNWFKAYNDVHAISEQVRPFNFLLSFQVDPLADETWDIDSDGLQQPVAPYDRNPARAARKCFDRKTGRPIRIDQLQTYRRAVAQYHLCPEVKFLNGRRQDRGPTRRRHVKIDVSDIRYVGKETNELEEQIAFGFDPEAQPDFGIEGEAYIKLLAEAKRAIQNYGARNVGKATQISGRYLREIRDRTPKVSPDLLKRIEAATPALQATRIQQECQNQRILEWLKTECARMGGLRELARQLHIDPANLAKMLSGRRRLSKILRGAFEVSE